VTRAVAIGPLVAYNPFLPDSPGLIALLIAFLHSDRLFIPRLIVGNL
jgi:uncharacterized protein (DUF2062 family)